MHSNFDMNFVLIIYTANSNQNCCLLKNIYLWIHLVPNGNRCDALTTCILMVLIKSWQIEVTRYNESVYPVCLS